MIAELKCVDYNNESQIVTNRATIFAILRMPCHIFNLMNGSTSCLVGTASPNVKFLNSGIGVRFNTEIIQQRLKTNRLRLFDLFSDHCPDVKTSCGPIMTPEQTRSSVEFPLWSETCHGYLLICASFPSTTRLVILGCAKNFPIQHISRKNKL